MRFAAIQTEIRALLLGLRNEDGGWAGRRGGPSTTEATSLAVLAMPPAHPRDPAQTGLEWLRQRQRPDGSWPPSDQAPLSSWMTPLAVLALARSRPDRKRVLQGAGWLLEQEGRGYPWYTRLFFRLFPERDVIELDADLTGWPWMPDTFSWVEPTAYALLALKALRSELPDGTADSRIAEGERMILDRMCAGGGWNYGNSRVMDEELWPYADTTALALIALEDLPRDARIRQSLAALRRMATESGSGLALALSVLCFDVYGEPAAGLRARLERGIEDLAGIGETRAIALALMALDGTVQPPFGRARRARS